MIDKWINRYSYVIIHEVLLIHVKHRFILKNFKTCKKSPTMELFIGKVKIYFLNLTDDGNNRINN